MKRILCYLTILAFAFLTTNCETNSDFNSHGFKGEYQMRTEIFTTNAEGEVEQKRSALISQVQMFVKKKHLYVWTNWFGMPNMGNNDEAEHEYTIDDTRYENVALTIAKNKEGNNSVEDEELIAGDIKPFIVLSGVVRVVYGHIYLQSLPIKALAVKNDRIIFGNSDEFEFESFTNDNKDIITLRCHFEYGPAIRENDTIKWDVDLCIDPVESTSNPNYYHHIKYHNTLVRK